MALVVALSMGLVACGGNDDDTAAAGDSGGGTTAEQPAATASKCGLGTGEKASGEPIKLGAIVTKQPGQDMSPATNMAKAYFDCVNDNGGINGRPVSYTVQAEQSNPQQVASLTAKLWQDDGILGFVGNGSILDCPVNQKFYAANHINVIGVGITRQCYESPNFASVSSGPSYSTLGAAQYLDRQGAKSLIAVTGKQPGGEYFTEMVSEYAKSKGIKTKSFYETMPINDGAAVALQLADAAGEGGGVVMGFTPPEALKILQGAEQQGLIDKVKWACSAPCNDTSVAQALGPAWDGKLGINADINRTDSDGPDMQLYRDVQKQYAPGTPPGSFGQMGFLSAAVATKALLDMKDEDYTKETVNAAFRGVEDYKTDLLCKPWYFGPGDLHVPVNTAWTVVPEGDKFVQKEGCTEFAALPGNHLTEVRATEGGGA